jgi:hypothetical protein
MSAAAPTQTFVQDLFSQQSIALVILFVLLSSPDAYRMTEGIIGRHGTVNVAVHGLVMVALAMVVLPYFVGGKAIGFKNLKLQPVNRHTDPL